MNGDPNPSHPRIGCCVCEVLRLLGCNRSSETEYKNATASHFVQLLKIQVHHEPAADRTQFDRPMSHSGQHGISRKCDLATGRAMSEMHPSIRFLLPHQTPPNTTKRLDERRHPDLAVWSQKHGGCSQALTHHVPKWAAYENADLT